MDHGRLRLAKIFGEMKYLFCGGEGKQRRKRRKIFGYGFFFWGRRKIAKEKEESIWRRKIFGTQWIRRTERENLLENPSHDA